MTTSPQPPSDEQAREDDYAAKCIMAFLGGEDYFVCQKAIIFLESYGDKLEVYSLSQFRDSLDHLVRAAQKGISHQDVDTHMTEVREHLRRSAVTPYQDAIDKQLGYLEGIARSYSVREAVYNNVPKQYEFRNRLQEAQKLLEESRVLKPHHSRTIDAVNRLQECYEVALSLRRDITPSGGALVVRLTLFLVTVGVTATLTFLITVLLSK